MSDYHDARGTTAIYELCRTGITEGSMVDAYADWLKANKGQASTNASSASTDPTISAHRRETFECVAEQQPEALRNWIGLEAYRLGVAPVPGLCRFPRPAHDDRQPSLVLASLLHECGEVGTAHDVGMRALASQG